MAAKHSRKSRQLYVLTGAGLSAGSGVPTFRDENGNWHDTAHEDLFNFNKLDENRAEFIGFCNMFKHKVRSAEPNAGHHTLAVWQQRWSANRVHLLTQNTDDLLERAGALAVTHLHGQLHRVHCVSCKANWEVGHKFFDLSVTCPRCKSHRVKPYFRMQGEESSAYLPLVEMHQVIRPHDLILVIGTSLKSLEPSCALPVKRGGSLRNYQINVEPVATELFGINLAMEAITGLQKLEPEITRLMGMD
jgi:NAD-dependent deacetylase